MNYKPISANIRQKNRIPICHSRKDRQVKKLSYTTVPLNLDNIDRRRLQLRQPGKNALRVQKQAFSIYLYRLKIVGTFSLYILETVLEEICAMFYEEMFFSFMRVRLRYYGDRPSFTTIFFVITRKGGKNVGGVAG